MNFEIKRNGLILILGFGALCTFLIWHGDVTWKEAAAFLSGTALFPGLFGRKANGVKTVAVVESEEDTKVEKKKE